MQESGVCYTYWPACIVRKPDIQLCTLTHDPHLSMQLHLRTWSEWHVSEGHSAHWQELICQGHPNRLWAPPNLPNRCGQPPRLHPRLYHCCWRTVPQPVSCCRASQHEEGRSWWRWIQPSLSCSGNLFVPAFCLCLAVLTAVPWIEACWPLDTGPSAWARCCALCSEALGKVMLTGRCCLHAAAGCWSSVMASAHRPVVVMQPHTVLCNAGLKCLRSHCNGQGAMFKLQERHTHIRWVVCIEVTALRRELTLDLSIIPISTVKGSKRLEQVSRIEIRPAENARAYVCERGLSCQTSSCLSMPSAADLCCL